jgi:outer membrane autotransporter protein
LTRRGFTVGYGDARGDVDGRDYQSENFRYAGVGKVDTRSYSLGAYQTNFWGNGIYLDLVGQVSLLDSKLRDVENHRARTQGWNAYLSTELGQTIPFGKGDWRIEPQVQVTLSRTDMDKFNDGEVYVDSVSQDLVRARAGAWLFNNFQTNSGNNTMFYMLANVWHDVTKPNRVKLSDTADALQLRPDVVRTWAELGVGFQQTLANSRLTLFGDVRGQHAISAGDRDGYGAQIGVKANW